MVGNNKMRKVLWLLFLSLGWGSLHAQTPVQWGCVPTDVAMGAYTLAWKTTLDTATKSSLNLRGSILLGDVELEAEALGWQYDEWGNWTSVPGELTASWNGLRLEGAYRQQHTPEYNGPKGMFTGAYFGFSRSTVTVQETVGAELEDEVFGAFGLDLASHELIVMTGALGLELGWAQANPAGGWSWECFIAPVFTGVIRKYDADLTIWEQEDALDQAMVNRLQTAYEAPWSLRPFYLMNVGPWLRAGVVFYRIPKQKNLN